MKHILFTVFVFLGLTAQSQTDTSHQLRFDTTAWDFGSITRNIQVTHKFWFKNAGTAPAVIISAIGSGGGALPSNWTRDPVLPGDSGFVEILYGAFNPGFFTKVITVHSNAGEFSLTIKGQVLLGPVITFERKEYDFGDIPVNQPVSYTFRFVNTGDEPLLIVNVFAEGGGGHIPRGYTHEPVPPGDTGYVAVEYSGPVVKDFVKTLLVHSNAGKFELAIKGNVLNGPRITFDKTIHNFGDIFLGTDTTAKFSFTNTGDMPLIISQTYAAAFCLAEYNRELIMPGKTGEIKVSYNPSNEGSFTKSVTVVSNAREVSLTIHGNVVYKPTEPKP